MDWFLLNLANENGNVVEPYAQARDGADCPFARHKSDLGAGAGNEPWQEFCAGV
jgi:hypothetical protein